MSYGNGSNLTGVTAGPGSSYYIQNGTLQQYPANFNIGGNGTAISFNSATTYQIGTNNVLGIGNSGDNNLFVGVAAGSSDVAGQGQINVFSGFVRPASLIRPGATIPLRGLIPVTLIPRASTIPLRDPTLEFRTRPPAAIPLLEDLVQASRTRPGRTIPSVGIRPVITTRVAKTTFLLDSTPPITMQPVATTSTWEALAAAPIPVMKTILFASEVQRLAAMGHKQPPTSRASMVRRLEEVASACSSTRMGNWERRFPPAVSRNRSATWATAAAALYPAAAGHLPL